MLGAYNTLFKKDLSTGICNPACINNCHYRSFFILVHYLKDQDQ